MSNSNFVNDLQDAIRQNPVSAALVGMGVLWMFTGGNRISAAAALFPAAAKSIAGNAAEGLARSADAAASAGNQVRSASERIVEGVRDTATQAVSAVGDAASGTFDTVKGAVPDIKRAARTQAETGGVGGVLQNNLKETFERQPLLLGAIGLAIGAGMAAAVPPTELERDFAGDTAAKVTADAKEFAGTQVDKAKAVANRTLEAVKDEIEAQGLTADAAKEGAAAIGGKLKSVARAARRKSV